MTLMIAVERAQTVKVHANAPEAAPPPLGAAMHAVVVMVATPKVPIAADIHPARAGPAPQDAQAIQVTARPTPPAPEPPRTSIIVVAAPQVPIRAHSSPMTLVVAIQGSQAVEVHANAAVSSPGPTVTSVKMMVVVIAPIQVPVCTDCVPASSVPSLVNPQAVSMTPNLPVASPEPTWSLVVIIATVEVPVGADAAPMSLVVSVQCAQAIEVHADSSVPAPLPVGSSMEPMIVCVFAVQNPIAAHVVPMGTCPSLVHPQAILVPTDAAVGIGPEPTGTLVVMIATPQMPIRTHTTPMALMVPVQCAQSIQMNTNAPIPTPSPLVPSVQMVIVVVPTVQVPVRSDIVPSCTIPAPQNPEAVQMSSNPSITSPEPARSPVVVIATPQVPVCAHASPFTLIVAVQGA